MAHEIYKFGRLFLGHQNYTLKFIWTGVDKEMFLRNTQFHTS